MKVGDDVVCLKNAGWTVDGPGKGDIVKIREFDKYRDFDDIYFSFEQYHPEHFFRSDYFAPVAPQSAIDELMKEVDELQKVAI